MSSGKPTANASAEGKYSARQNAGLQSHTVTEKPISAANETSGLASGPENDEARFRPVQMEIGAHRCISD